MTTKRNINRSFYSKNSMLEISYYRQKETNKITMTMSIYKVIGHTTGKDGKELPLFRSYNDVKEDRCTTKMDFSEIAMIQKLCEVASVFGIATAAKIIKELDPNQNYLADGFDAKISIFHSETLIELSVSQKYSGMSVSLVKFKDSAKPKYSFFIRRNDMFGLSMFLSNILLLNTLDESEDQPNWDEIRKKNIPDTVKPKDTLSNVHADIIDDMFLG